ncbi:glycosyltransferase family 8 protein [Lactiplantibacillus plantarum]|nr:glycosyltransferase family 8 protein [Lactiplantibacillus plantarum]
MSQYTRLLIGSILPTNVIKVLYLDCDTLILGNVLKIWNLNLADKIIAALPDVFSPAYRRNIGLHRESIMFNSGVMLIDLRHWRENNTEAKLLEVIDVYHGRVQQGDQGVLNAVLSNEVVALDPRDNSISLFFDFSYEEMLILRKPLSTFTQEELNMAINHPRIVHFTTSFASTRPWYLGPASQKYSAIWRDYYSQTEWANEPLEEKKISFLKKIMMMIYSGLPREIAIRIAGLSHAIFRPGVTRLKQFFLR